MPEDSKIRDAADAIKGIAQAVPVYQAVLQPAAQEIVVSLQTVAKTIHIALAPVSALVWGYDSMLDVDGVSYLFPSDGLQSHPHDTAIELKWVQDTLQHSKAQVKVLIFDACHSGALRGRS